MLHLYVGSSEALNALLQELEGQVRLVGGQPLADALDEDRVVRRNAQTYHTHTHTRSLTLILTLTLTETDCSSGQH